MNLGVMGAAGTPRGGAKESIPSATPKSVCEAESTVLADASG